MTDQLDVGRRTRRVGRAAAGMRVQVFLRTYQHDFAPAERDRILAYIRQK